MDNNTTTNFSDVFKDNFLSGFSLSTQNLTLPNVLISLGIAFLLGMVIYFIYKKTYRGVLYSHSFNLSLIMLSMVTTLVIMCISSAPALSLGMVGALSIVRFRTAVKDPMDTAYMFWALTMGILLGAKLYAIALVVAAAIAAIIFLLTFVHFTTPNSYLLVVHYDEEVEYDVDQMMRRSVKNRRLRSKTMTRSGAEMTWEVRLDNKQDLVALMLGIEGVHDATLVACQTEAGT